MGDSLVLIVEDNPPDAKLVRDVMQARGYRVAEATTAERGLEILVSERVLAAVEARVHAEPVGELELKGLRSPLRTHNVLSLRD